MDGKEDIIDVGSGFGVPGIPLSLIFPGNKMVMLDSVGKKINFIKSIVDTMDLANAETALGRAEELAKKEEHRQTYSVVLSRAVAVLPVLLELTLPFCRLGGVVVAMKGRRALSEVNDSEKALELLGGEIEEVVDVKPKLPFSSGQLVLIRKVSETPEMFPRKAGIPQKRPL
jgi:16S rRNA (guanine527-N7)-methyltransferase